MADHAQVALTTAVQPVESAVAIEQESSVPRAQWSLALRIAFRFCVAYFTLFSLSNQILGGLLVIPKVDIPELSGHWPLRQITFWTAAHIFHIKHDLVYTGSGSGDKTFDWVLAFCLLVIAAVITLVWSILDRRRNNYVTFHKWFRLALRFALASEMFLYGLDKVIPLQMPFPYLTRLLEPYGNFSPMAVLWSSIGASRSYEIFAGCAETLGGILLLTPRTTTLGALVCLADMIQVFMLNMTYDVPVKLFSFHLILFSLFLLAPDARRMSTSSLLSVPQLLRGNPLYSALRAPIASPWLCRLPSASTCSAWAFIREFRLGTPMAAGAQSPRSTVSGMSMRCPLTASRALRCLLTRTAGVAWSLISPPSRHSSGRMTPLLDTDQPSMKKNIRLV